MKKTLTVLGLVTATGLAASPFIIGSQIEAISREQVNIAQQELKQVAKTNAYIQQASFNLEEYEKGYLDSTARSSIHLEMLFPGQESSTPVNIPLTSEITHGPYLGEAGFGLAKIVSKPDTSKMELPDFIKADSFIIEGTIKMNGDIREIITIKPINMKTDAGIHINLEGIKATINSHTHNRQDFAGDVAVSTVKITDTNTENLFQIKPFEIDIQGRKNAQNAASSYQFNTSEISAEGSEGLQIKTQKLSSAGSYQPIETVPFSVGEQQTIFTNVEINNPSALPAPIKIPEIQFKSLLEQNNAETLDLTIAYDFMLDPSLMTALQSPVDVKTAKMDIRIDSLSSKALQAYTELVQQLDAQQTQTSNNNHLIQEQITDIMQTIIQNNASAFMSLTAKTTEGNANAALDISLIKDHGLDKAAMTELLSTAAISGPGALLPLLNAKGHINLDKSVLDKAGITPMVQIMAGQFVSLEDEVFKSELLIKDGEMLINGQALLLAGSDTQGTPVSKEPAPEDASGNNANQASEQEAATQ